jgi:nucleotide-binding universal stress UspA family protein
MERRGGHGCGHPVAVKQPESVGHQRAASRVLLAVDPTAASPRATAAAIAAARDGRADLVVLSVVEPRHLRLPGGWSRRVDQERDRLASGAQTIVRRARDVGVGATYLIWEGDPAEAILDAAGSEGADLIVLGSRGRTDLRRLLLGSVSSEVARRATCRVEVVPG